ncbi:nucleolar protein 8 [Mesocricetus auratus]|uniref:Nucleolar protein 8 n=1 Tax=Mesocricetus auratus TaxID=10036 RepID=A0A1U8BIW1_MESAU|nr:nucleolar protein 8 [Mesocricetus auratus]XP_012966134.1 nucleolar protein 8 [Mesocricetus auratus]XP_012966135.1 nucleolar protein 8 [Mesocricetus auratus]XP_012966136.1 nucleolar protein 8 [Mesocricetus auratus]XP_012966137.1 nucleolar protein 8 [Mesocricetus auratus]XP_021080582.1 nucleolar protein 8 [Mesocricetus auratus]XP_021080583.1 nucleolar protein 8 [Mesocricetus auratus]XP_040611891.1 nucleolar protein 8 [Mesocricetus auratus]
MKPNREMKRLFVGGLGQGISETDLQNQFSRFGEVSDVEIISRKDDQGNSQKVFAYVNIKITEADLKKCMSILNKTKWKGGTLQIQLAKESFLHRLAQEREEAKAKKEKSATGNSSLLEKIGGVEFHMKAVPGTEVPGHKNWVVSKFGRVLPVLHLKSQHKHKIMKYDPSKYCHNLKKIAENLTKTIPITDLTWELEGGNDPMSKKRRGEFSDFHSPPQKMKKVQKSRSPMEFMGFDDSLRTKAVMESHKATQPVTAHKKAPSTVTPSESLLVSTSSTPKPNHVVFHNSDFEIIRNKSSMSDDDIDSEDELKMMIAKEENLQKTRHSLVNESENDPFEVVKDDFKSDIHKLPSSTNLGNDYDSSDTDEIIAMKKNIVKVKNSTESSQPEKPISKKSSFKKTESSNDCIKVQKTKSNKESALGHGVKFLSPKFPPDSNMSDSEESEEDEEYKALMKNCPRVNLTLADLEQLAGSHQKVPGKDNDSDDPQNSNHCIFDTDSKSPKTSYDLYNGRQCICPEDIVASLLEEEDNCSKQKPEETTLKPKFQAFKGIGNLYAKESVDKTLKETDAFNNINEHQSSLKHEDPNRIFIENESECANGSLSKLTSCQPAKVNSPNHIQPPKRQYSVESQSHEAVSSTSFDKESKNPLSCPLTLKGKKSLSLRKSHKTDCDRDTCHRPESRKASEEECTDSSSITSLEQPRKVCLREDPQQSTAGFSLSVSNASCVSAKDKHSEDNQKRLAALAVRQKAREVQKKLVHNALANLDGHLENKKTHIVFASDNESETEETSTHEQNCPGKEVMKESVVKASGRLFDSSDDEESDSKEDSTRFNIKPQFEGRAGQKLMNLQSHFGSDERFQMDSRFLESDSEEEQKELNENKTNEDELAAEKKKTLNVVQSVLNINLNNPTSKGSVIAKKFKDIVHYDPTKHDHAIYERKQEDKEKESKAKRKKKREEAEKLPEVSQDMYYNIATDLKEIFQSTNTNEKEEDAPWNEDCSREETGGISNATTLTSGAEQTSGFTFSFFDSDTKDVKEDTYKIEPVKRGKMKIVCLEDSRFQDSSSEEEEEEEEDVTQEEDHEKPSSGEAFPEKETTRFFFFAANDDRLRGSNLFWSGVGSSVSRSSWETRTSSLLLDCRKKHKEAKRKVKAN